MPPELEVPLPPPFLVDPRPKPVRPSFRGLGRSDDDALADLPDDGSFQAERKRERERLRADEEARQNLEKAKAEAWEAKQFEQWRTSELPDNIPNGMAKLLYLQRRKRSSNTILRWTEWDPNLCPELVRLSWPFSSQQSLPYSNYTTYEKLKDDQDPELEQMSLELARQIFENGFDHYGKYVLAAAFIRLFLSDKKEDWELAIAEWSRLEDGIQHAYTESLPYRKILDASGEARGSWGSFPNTPLEPDDYMEYWLPSNSETLTDREARVGQQLINFLSESQAPHRAEDENEPDPINPRHNIDLRKKIIWQLTTLAVLRSRELGWRSSSGDAIPSVDDLREAFDSRQEDSLRELLRYNTPLASLFFDPQPAEGERQMSDPTWLWIEQFAKEHEIDLSEARAKRHERYQGLEASTAIDRSRVLSNDPAGIDAEYCKGFCDARWRYDFGLEEPGDVFGAYRDLIIRMYSDGSATKSFQLQRDWQLKLDGCGIIVFAVEKLPEGLIRTESLFRERSAIFDYFDSFMLLAATAATIFGEQEITDGNFALIGDNPPFGLGTDGDRGLIHVLKDMTVLCAKMPAWQREQYAAVIAHTFEIVQELRYREDAAIIRRLRFGANRERLEIHDNDRYSERGRHRRRLVWQAEQQKDVAQLLRFDQEHLPLPVHADAVPQGMEDQLFLGADGRLYPLQSQEDEVELPPVKVESTELASLIQDMKITAAERGVPEAVQLMTAEVMKRPKKVTLDAIADGMAAFEAVLGSELSPELHIFIQQMADVRAALFVDIETPEQLAAAVQAAQDFSAEGVISEKEISGIFMLFIAVFGEVPKQFVTEYLFQIIETISQAYVLRLVAGLQTVTERKLTLLGIKEVPNSPILTAKSAITQIVGTTKSADLSGEQKLAIIGEVDRVLRYLTQNRKYDFSVHDPLSSLLTLDKEGILSGRCSSQAMVLESVLGFVLGDVGKINSVSLFGFSGDLSVTQWLEQLRQSGEHGANSHRQVGIGIGNSSLVADLTWDVLEPVVCETDQPRTKLLDRSEVRNMSPEEPAEADGWLQGLKAMFRKPQTRAMRLLAGRGIWQGAKGESSLPHASFAAGIFQLYPELALFGDQLDPDNLRRSVAHVLDSVGDSETRRKELDKLIAVDPYLLGFDIAKDFSLGFLIERSRVLYNRVTAMGRFEVALFISAILSNHKRASDEAHQEGANLREQTLQKIGRLSEKEMEACVARAQNLPTPILSPQDMQEVRETWLEVQAELAQQLAILQVWAATKAGKQFMPGTHRATAVARLGTAAQALGHQLPLSDEVLKDPKLLAGRFRQLAGENKGNLLLLPG